MDYKLFFKLVIDCKKSLDEHNFKEANCIFSILNYLYANDENKEYWEFYELLRSYEARVKNCQEPNDVQKVVYFIKDLKSNLVKIGCSKDLDNRLKQLKTSYETDFQVLFTVPVNGDMYKAEHFFHNLFKKYKVKREFFNLPSKLLNSIQSMSLEGKSLQEIKRVIQDTFVA